MLSGRPRRPNRGGRRSLHFSYRNRRRKWKPWPPRLSPPTTHPERAKPKSSISSIAPSLRSTGTRANEITRESGAAMTTFKTTTQVDFVVIGSGAGGGIVAKELSTAGFQVVLLEQGPYLREKDFPLDELYYRNNPLLMNDRRLQPSTFRRTEQEKATQANTVSYGRCIGGGTVHYTGVSTRHHEIDFVERGVWG